MRPPGMPPGAEMGGPMMPPNVSMMPGQYEQGAAGSSGSGGGNSAMMNMQEQYGDKQSGFYNNMGYNQAQGYSRQDPGAAGYGSYRMPNHYSGYDRCVTKILVSLWITCTIRL